MFEGTNKFLFNGDHVVVRFRDMSFVYIAVLLFYWQHQRVSLSSTVEEELLQRLSINREKSGKGTID